MAVGTFLEGVVIPAVEVADGNLSGVGGFLYRHARRRWSDSGRSADDCFP
jgi:hypothetical protein